MRSKSRRYEVLLPVRFNDGRNVPEELLGEALNEIVEQITAVSFQHRVTHRPSSPTVADTAATASSPVFPLPGMRPGGGCFTSHARPTRCSRRMN